MSDIELDGPPVPYEQMLNLSADERLKLFEDWMAKRYADIPDEPEADQAEAKDE